MNVIVTVNSPMREKCCVLHTIKCEPGELCCDQCTEVDHPRHEVRPWCVLEAPPAMVDEITDMLAGIERNYDREGAGPGSRFEGQRLEFAQARSVVRKVLWLAARQRDAS